MLKIVALLRTVSAALPATAAAAGTPAPSAAAFVAAAAGAMGGLGGGGGRAPPLDAPLPQVVDAPLPAPPEGAPLEAALPADALLGGG